jgi:signal transduction histidine kinase
MVAIIAFVFATATLLIGGIAYEVTHEALEEQLDHRIATETSALLAEARDGGLAGIAAAIRLRDAARSASSLDYLLVDDNGLVLAGDLVADVPPEGYEEFLGYRNRQSGREGIAQAVTTRLPGATLVVAADRADLTQIDRTITALFSIALTTMLAAGVMAAVLVGWITRRRLSRIDATAKAIIGGDLKRRIPLDGTRSEFDELAITLNEMLNRINALMDNLSQVSTDVAHDLRTPLTRLSNRLDRASAATNPEDLQEQLGAAKAEAEGLLELFAALLRIAEIEGMAARLPKRPLDLSALVEQLADTYRPDMEEEQRQFMVSIEPGMTILGDRRLLSQLIANLLDNALRHTPRGTTVELDLSRAEYLAILTVSDHGSGVEPEDARRIFQRFVRGEKSRSKPGHGLGLAIVEGVAAAHSGSAKIGSTQPFEIRVSLPLLE